MTYLVLKYLHVIGASILLGTGAGIAFFMVLGHLTNNPGVVAAIARIVVIADFLFTATAAIVQPITGIALAWHLGWSLWEGWLALSIGLYLFTGAFWLPVIWMQMSMRDLAAAAAANRTELPVEYNRLFWWWFAFGFAAVLVIFWLMIAKPQIVLWS
jgi:uncharacterized membrane protein